MITLSKLISRPRWDGLGATCKATITPEQLTRRILDWLTQGMLFENLNVRLWTVQCGPTNEPKRQRLS